MSQQHQRTVRENFENVWAKKKLENLEREKKNKFLDTHDLPKSKGYKQFKQIH